MELFLDGLLYDGDAELVEGQVVELSALPPAGAALALELGDTPLEPFLRPGDPAWRWRWLAPASAGAYALLLRATWPSGQSEELRRVARVAPRKLDQERYAAILDDLQQLGRALVFALIGGAESAASPRELDRSAPTPAEEIHGLFGAEFERLAGAVERLARRPPERLRHLREQTAPALARDLSRIDWPQLFDNNQAAAADTQHPATDPASLVHRLSSLPERTTRPSYDSYEARLLRRLLDTLWRRLGRLIDQDTLPPSLADRAAATRERLRSLRSLPFLAEVPPLAAYSGPTPRMQRDAEYRVVYRVWRLLRRRPLLSWDQATLSIPVGDLPRLYERWCAACVALALLELPGHRVLDQSLLTDEGDEQLLALPEESPLVALEAPGGRRLTLHYHPRYKRSSVAHGRVGPASSPPAPLNAHPGPVPPVQTQLVSLDRHTRVPDLAVQITQPGERTHVVVLDAKYRLDATGGVPEEALADAYSYLGSIGAADGSRATLAVALLYPGRGKAEVYPSGVAALPLLPGDTEALRAWLTDMLHVRAPETSAPL